VPLERALTLAEPEGYVRIFLDEAKPMAELLNRMAADEETPRIKAYIQKLLSAFDELKKIGTTSPTSKRKTGSSIREEQAVNPQPLIEPLSERELEVLRMLRTELSGPEIARQQMVSLSTIRTHTQRIFAKLGVNNRRTAVRRAEELDLF
jgi:LuxR family maltose regulon positive regulatory protein